MDASPLALPVGSLLLLAFGLTALLSGVEGFIAHAFYIALQNQNNFRGYSEVSQAQTYETMNSSSKHKILTHDGNIKLATMLATPSGVGTGMRIDPFVQSMQSRFESAKNVSHSAKGF